MERRPPKAGDAGHVSSPSDDRPSAPPESRPALSSRGSLGRAIAQNRAFMELSRIIAAGDQGLWTSALGVMLGPAGASWGAAYRLSGPALELIASEALPVALKQHVETFDVQRHAAFAGCRSARSRRPTGGERLFAGVVEPRALAQLEAAGISAGVSVPLVHSGEVLGVLIAGALWRDALEADGLPFLDAVASLLAPAIALFEGGRQSRGDARRSSAPPRPGSVPPVRPLIDVSRAALDAVHQAGPLARRMGTDVRTAVGDGCATQGDASDLRIAILHLLTNAIDAAVDRAPLSGAPGASRRVRVSATRSGGAVVVEVEDSGRGVAHDLRSRVFDAGFSTKGKGRGNGLPSVRRIAKDLGGHVEIGASELGGASFRLVLPAAGARLEAAPPRRGLSATWPRFRAPSERRGGTGEGEDEDTRKVVRPRPAAVS